MISHEPLLFKKNLHHWEDINYSFILEETGSCKINLLKYKNPASRPNLVLTGNHRHYKWKKRIFMDNCIRISIPLQTTTSSLTSQAHTVPPTLIKRKKNTITAKAYIPPPPHPPRPAPASAPAPPPITASTQSTTLSAFPLVHTRSLIPPPHPPQTRLPPPSPHAADSSPPPPHSTASRRPPRHTEHANKP